MPDDTPGPLGNFAERYELDSELGSGAFGHVFAARDSSLDFRRVALKLFPAGSDLDQAIYEATYLERIRSPKVAPVFDAGIYGDVPFLVTEIAPLGSLADVLPPHGMEVFKAVDLVRQVLVAVDVCHSRRLLHRDIKPSNVFCYGESEVRLGDFGVSAEMRADGTADAHGDPPIRPPEAWLSNTMSAASDIYQVGLLLYHLLTGSNPFAHCVDVPATVVAADFEDILDLAPHVPLDLARHIRKALAWDPAQRFGTADEMHTALQLKKRVRRWTPVAPKGGSCCAWLGYGHGRTLRVSVAATGSTFDIVTCYEESGNRIRRHCHDGVAKRALPVQLRRLFRQLSSA